MAGSDIATITVNGRESKMQVATLLSILNGAICYNIDCKRSHENETIGDLLRRGSTESVENALLNLKYFKEELALIESIKTELEIGR